MFEKLAVQELFPTPLWICDLTEAHHRRLNADLKARIERLIEPRPAIELGSTWQTDPILHQLPQFADFIAIVEGAARGAFEFLGLSYESFEITGCWANVNPQGGLNSSHNHPNNYLSGVYYLRTHPDANTINFLDPRQQAAIIRPPVTALTAENTEQVVVQVQDGTLLLFPAWLRHSVDANRSGRLRISLGFNIMFTQYAETMAQPLWQPGSRPSTS